MKLIAFFIIMLSTFSLNAETPDIYKRGVAEDKLKPILTALKDGVKARDIYKFSDYIYFPLNISFEETFIDASGNLRIKTQKIENAGELSAKFDDVFTPTVIELIECITPQNMLYNSYKGFSAAFGAIWFFDIQYSDSGLRLFALSSISTNETATRKWIIENCKS